VLYLLSVAVGLLLLLPEVFLVLQARGAGWSEVHRVLARPLTAELLRNTVELTVVVGIATGIIGTAAAWCVVRTALPMRRMWGALVVLPISIPDFIVGYAWHSMSPDFVGLHAAAVVMTLDLYPLVYLPVAAALRRTDPTLEETAQALGLGAWATFRRVVFPQFRPALFGGMLVVTLALLAEFGAFEILNFRTFTTEIFTGASTPRRPPRCRYCSSDSGSSCSLPKRLVPANAEPRAPDHRPRGRRSASRSATGWRPCCSDSQR
jgi:iron(III) transport system permease protein